MRTCAHSKCITILSRYNEERYCSVHARPDPTVRDAVLFIEVLREPGVLPWNQKECECGRLYSSTSCVCKASPAPVPWGVAA